MTGTQLARLMADHLAMMAFYIDQAGNATRELGGALIVQEGGGPQTLDPLPDALSSSGTAGSD
jgi:hypothetical protein